MQIQCSYERNSTYAEPKETSPNPVPYPEGIQKWYSDWSTSYAQHSVTKNLLYSSIIEMQIQSSYCCVCFVLPIHSEHKVRWTYQPGSHRRKVTQDFLSSFLGCWCNVWLVFGLLYWRRPQVACLILKKTSRRTQAVVVSEGMFCAARCCVIFYLQSMKVYTCPTGMVSRTFYAQHSVAVSEPTTPNAEVWPDRMRADSCLYTSHFPVLRVVLQPVCAHGLL